MYCRHCGGENKDDANYCKYCGGVLKSNKNFVGKQDIKNILHSKKVHGFLKSKLFKIPVVILGIASIFLIAVPLYSNYFIIKKQVRIQKNVIPSIVNIMCSDAKKKFSLEDVVTGGSGTIITSEGVVITNMHIFPDTKGIYNNDCLIMLPNQETGLAEEMYLGYPIIIPKTSEEYDLALIKIYKEYVDGDGISYGQYPKKFPILDNSGCSGGNLSLGEYIKIYGYPTIGGNYNLTITDGILSSFLEDGLITTSAKISQGNSGGLAVDSAGCMIGIPTFVSSDELESLGVIITTNMITEFLNKAIDYIEKIEASS